MTDTRPPGERVVRSGRKPPPAPVSVDHGLWRHCLESCPLVSLGVLFAAWLLPSRIPLWEITGPLAVLTMVTWLTCHHVTRSPALSTWLLTWGAALSAWMTAARLAGPWTAHVLDALVLITVVLTPLGPPAIAAYRSGKGRDAHVQERERQQAELNRWETMFTRMGIRGVRVTEVFRHANGLELHGSLGKATDEHGVVTFDRLKQTTADVATHERKARDAVHFEQPDPDNSAAFVMHVRTRKGKRPVAMLPENDHPATVSRPLELGLHDNGKKFGLLLREIVLMVIGSIGSGKTNALNVLIAQLARCEDVIIFAIEIDKGRMSRPWILPWIEDPDGVRRPVIDWLASTRAEADLMLDTLLAAGAARARKGSGGDKLDPRRDRPQVVLVVDETAVATGHDRKDDGISSRKLAVKVARLAETYRSEAFVPVISCIRGDVESLGLSAIKAQALGRIGLRVSQSADGQSIFPDDHAAAKALAAISDDGAGLALLKGKMSNPVHFYRVTPKLAYARAVLTGPWRPAPDPHLEAAMNEVKDSDGKPAYETRWKRAEDLVEAWKRDADEWCADPEVGITDDMRAGRAVPRTAPEGGIRRRADLNGIDVDREFRELVAQTEDPDGKVHPARQRMRELLFRAGPHGYTAGALVKALKAEELTVHRNTVHEWLRADESLGRVRRKGRAAGDPYARWSWISQAGDDDLLAGGRGTDPGDDEEDWR